LTALSRNHPSSPVAAYFLTRELYKYDYEALKKLRSQFSDSLSNHPYIKSIDRTLASLENVQPGKPAPDFTLASANGDSISLSSLRGKYVLVDFGLPGVRIVGNPILNWLRFSKSIRIKILHS
jgi:hypothetical protein